MRRRRSTCRSVAAALAAAAFAALPAKAWAQACCAGSSAVTPARLAIHEDAIVGMQLRGAGVLGSYDARGAYRPSPSGASELDFEQDLLGAIRFFHRGQAALFVPLVETWRRAQGHGELGGGLGDINLSARYDFLLAGESRYVPGVAVLLGVTLPTGTPPESAAKPLATDATGTGAFAGNLGVAAEQIWGHWLVNLTGIVAKRAGRSAQGVDETLGTQWTGLFAVAYAFEMRGALGFLASYTYEGDATINGATSPGSAKSAVLASIAGTYPITDQWRLQASVFVNPPIGSFGQNQPATAGLTATILRAWP